MFEFGEERLTREEVLKLGSADFEFYGRFFFPNAFRQASPSFAPLVSAALDDPEYPFVNLQMFRGSSKTTRVRTWLSRRIAYGMSRMILVLGKSEDKSLQTVRWLRRMLHHNRRWSEVFGVAKGERWSDTGGLEFYHGIEEVPITVKGMGIGGPIRGENIDDYRPDTIVMDDIVDTEMVHTVLGRKKVTEVIFGDVKHSLEARSANPYAKLVNLGTPIAEGDPSTALALDPGFKTVRIPCWTPDTMEMEIDEQMSAWEQRYPSEELREEKREAIEMNRLYVFLREKELRLTSPETSSFRAEWIQAWEILPERHEFDYVVMFIDPVPPPSPHQIAEGLSKKDYEAFVVMGRRGEKFFVMECVQNRGHEPDWTIRTFFELATRWRPNAIYCESVAYQRTLAWLLRKAMQHRRQYFAVFEHDDKRSKLNAILDGLTGPLQNRQVYLNKNMVELRQQIEKHPDVEHDDLIECCARACEKLNDGALDQGALEGDSSPLGDYVERLEWRCSP